MTECCITHLTVFNLWFFSEVFVAFKLSVSFTFLLTLPQEKGGVMNVVSMKVQSAFYKNSRN